MVEGFRRSMFHQCRAAFTLAEVMVAMAIFSTVGLGLMIGFVTLERGYSATTDFAVSHGDEMRVSDYLALDFRRALSIDPLQPNDASIYIPAYYDSNNLPVTPTLDGQGGVYYGQLDASGKVPTVRVHYYLFNGCVYRQEGSSPAVVLATSVHALNFSAVTPADGKVVQTLITFAPKFFSDTDPTVINATAFYNTTLLRNKVY
jgi:prepilin-type N-terminal cleavage/methylation domain-containing protein